MSYTYQEKQFYLLNSWLLTVMCPKLVLSRNRAHMNRLKGRQEITVLNLIWLGKCLFMQD